ncbi:putative Phytochrome interacting factor 3 [Hibiscus syriacus]|uniref:Phytochrome interacting factor 3 n=1 Tax=Hibiscus syriacus TaxID=106335 RepID=A0A6A3B0S4_HIBSY|nr:putative Phytochrome interacting factor 3 [Hibiscus syriacus]
MRDCRSFGNIFHPSSQSRKVSIGIVLDSIAERKLGDLEEDKSKQPNEEKIKSANGISVEGKNKREVVTSSKGKQTEATEQVKSPWITPRSVHEKSLAPETASSNLGWKKHKKVKDVEVMHSFQFFSNQNFNAQNISRKANSFDFDDLSYKRKGRNDGNSQKVEEFNIANAGKVLESDKVVLESKADKTQSKQIETLKMRLQELLGNVSSPKSLLSSSQAQEVTGNNLKPKLSVDHRKNTVVNPRQNSENPDQTINRPVTRSLAQKRAPAKVQTDKTNVGLSSKQKHRQNISFREDLESYLGRTDEIKRTTYTSETSVPPRKSSIFVTDKKNQSVYCGNPTPLEKGDKHEDVGSISLRNVVCTPDNFQSPTFGFKEPILDTSTSPKPKTVEVEQGARSPIPSDREFTMGNVRGIRTFQASKPVSNILNSQAHSPISLSILQDYDMGVEHTKRYVHSESSSEERLSQSFEDGSPIIKRYDCHTENLISPDTVVSEKPNSMDSAIKRFHEDVRLSECIPTTTSRKGARTIESFWLHEPSEQDQEDELTRAVTLFASALKTFKRKMDSTTRNKSSEILVSISKEIKSLLSNARSEIESDVRKLIILNKTKRKRLEIGLQGHQKLLMHVEEVAEIKLNNAERRITAVHEASSCFLSY